MTYIIIRISREVDFEVEYTFKVVRMFSHLTFFNPHSELAKG